jgi:hypothetical protein
MKNLKYTLAALAIVAAASVSTAKAQSPAYGDVVLGVFNTTNSLEFDLGPYSTLSNNEAFNLGSVSSLAGSGLTFDIAGASGGTLGSQSAGGIPGADIVLTGSVFPATNPSSFGTEFTTIHGVTTNFQGGTAETPGTNVQFEDLQPSSNGGSFASEDGGIAFGLGSNYTTDQTWTGNDTADLYLLKPGAGGSTEEGYFTTSTTAGDTTLTYHTLATPEPSAYALGLVAVALFWVLKRRRSVA